VDAAGPRVDAAGPGVDAAGAAAVLHFCRSCLAGGGTGVYISELVLCFDYSHLQ